MLSGGQARRNMPTELAAQYRRLCLPVASVCVKTGRLVVCRCPFSSSTRPAKALMQQNMPVLVVVCVYIFTQLHTNASSEQVSLHSARLIDVSLLWSTPLSLSLPLSVPIVRDGLIGCASSLLLFARKCKHNLVFSTAPRAATLNRVGTWWALSVCTNREAIYRWLKWLVCVCVCVFAYLLLGIATGGWRFAVCSLCCAPEQTKLNIESNGTTSCFGLNVN